MITTYEDSVIELLGYCGRMISGSKSFYSAAFPDHVIVFNGNICTKTKGKIWYGDLDITKDEEKLKQFASLVGEDLYILREMDARFENEKAPLLNRAIAIVSPTEVLYAK
jgi:hypothetical protein